MSGLYYTTPSGKRTPLLAPPARTTRSTAIVEQVSLATGKGLSKSRGGAVTLQTHTRRGRPRRRATSPPSDDSSTADDEQDLNEDQDEDEDDENKSDDVEPAVIAPAHSYTGRGTGRKMKHQTSLHLSNHDVHETMFSMSDDDDDDIYLKVDDISDFESDEDEIEDEQELAEIWNAEDDPAAILNQLDGGSVFGFGADYFSGEDLNALTSDSDTDAEMDIQRHVHFSTEHELPRLATSSLSPLLNRTLLPSALPPLEIPAGFDFSEVATGLSARSSANKLADPFEEADPYDTDATADDLPPEALSRGPSPSPPNPDNDILVSTRSPPTSLKNKKNKKGKMKAKGPPTGIFVMDNAKPWGILDASGKKVVMVPAPDSSRHLWLDAKLQKEYDATPNASPAGLLDESDRSVTSSQEGAEVPMTSNVDIMLASLNSGRNTTELGQATGPAEAFYPQPGFQIAGDYVISPEGFAQLGETFSDVSDEADLPLNIDDIIEFDDESSTDDDSPTSPVTMTIHMPDELKGIGFGGVNNEYPHLNNRNVTAFRRNADPAQAVLNTTPTFSNFSPTEPAASRPETPANTRKRKATDLPYQSPVYQGVTPVRRHVWEPVSRKRARTLA